MVKFEQDRAYMFVAPRKHGRKAYFFRIVKRNSNSNYAFFIPIGGNPHEEYAGCIFVPKDRNYEVAKIIFGFKDIEPVFLEAFNYIPIV